MIDLSPINSADQIVDRLFALEVAAFVDGEIRIEDLPVDRDALTEWYIEQHVDRADQAAYREEFKAASDEAEEFLLRELAAEIDRRLAALGPVYPFRSDLQAGIILERTTVDNCSPQTVCYLWLSLFRATQRKEDYLTLLQAQKAAIRTKFEGVFEIIAAYALIGREDGPAWYFGSSRSVAKLLRILRHLSRRVGSGLVKTKDQLQANQIKDNDGGIDVVLVERREDATAFLVGATIQASDRRKKIVGPESLDRFNAYFVNNLAVALRGVLVVPYDKTEAEKINCAEKNCLYLHAESIISYLGITSHERSRETRYIRLKLREFTQSIHEVFAPAPAKIFDCAWA